MAAYGTEALNAVNHILSQASHSTDIKEQVRILSSCTRMCMLKWEGGGGEGGVGEVGTCACLYVCACVCVCECVQTPTCKCAC